MDLEQDFTDFVATRQRLLVRAAWMLTGDWAAAEDVVQAALAQAWRRWAHIRREGAADGYVYRCVVNSWRSSRRRRWWGERPHAVLPDGAQVETDNDLSLVLRQVLAALPPGQRAVVALRYLCDADERTTAEALGCSVGTVKSQASRGIAALRENAVLREAMESERS